MSEFVAIHSRYAAVFSPRVYAGDCSPHVFSPRVHAGEFLAALPRGPVG
jgi:hypothetical protein